MRPERSAPPALGTLHGQPCCGRLWQLCIRVARTLSASTRPPGRVPLSIQRAVPPGGRSRPPLRLHEPPKCSPCLRVLAIAIDGSLVCVAGALARLAGGLSHFGSGVRHALDPNKRGARQGRLANGGGAGRQPTCAFSRPHARPLAAPGRSLPRRARAAQRRPRTVASPRRSSASGPSRRRVTRARRRQSRRRHPHLFGPRGNRYYLRTGPTRREASSCGAVLSWWHSWRPR